MAIMAWTCEKDGKWCYAKKTLPWNMYGVKKKREIKEGVNPRMQRWFGAYWKPRLLCKYIIKQVFSIFKLKHFDLFLQ